MEFAPESRTKLIVRHIPAQLTEAQFLSILEPICKGKYDYFYFVPGNRPEYGGFPTNASHFPQ